MSCVAVLLLAAAATAQQSLAGPRLFPRGCRAPGIAEVGFRANTQTYHFTLKKLQGAIEVQYLIALNDPDVAEGMIRVVESTTGIVPIEKGGLTYRVVQPPAASPNSPMGTVLSPADLAANATTTLLQHSLDPATGVVTLRYGDLHNAAGSVPREKTYAFRLVGRSLEITVDGQPSAGAGSAHNYAGFSIAGGTVPGNARVLHVPYMDHVPVFAGGTPLAFCTRIIDWYSSNGSDCPSVVPAASGIGFVGGTHSGTYRNDQGDLNAPIHEVCYVTVSPRISDTFAIVDRPPSEYRLLTANRATSQNSPSQGYLKARGWVERARSHGVEDMNHIKWDWAKWPHNLNEPDYLPPPPDPFGTNWGTAAEWRQFADACRTSNWSLSPYLWGAVMDQSNYPPGPYTFPCGSAPPANAQIALLPNPLYQLAQCTQFADGTPKLGWDTNRNIPSPPNASGLGHQTHVLAPNLRNSVVGPMVASIQGGNGYVGFPTGGSHIDAIAEIPGWINVDQMAGSGHDRTIAQVLRSTENYFRQTKDGMNGPLFGENSHNRWLQFETFFAGLMDGSSRKIPIPWLPSATPSYNHDYLVLPDFELTEVLPKATGYYGMGWESHFMDILAPGHPSPPTTEPFMDAWHTTLLSYGHSAYFGTNGDVTNNYWDWRGTLRSYHLVHGLSKAMRTSTIQSVRYVDGVGAELALEAAIAAGLDLNHPRLALRFASGLEFKANHSATNWVTTVLGTAWTIPPNGFVGAAPNGLLAFSAINPNSAQNWRVDYAREPGVVEMIDRRGRNQTYAGFPAAGLLGTSATTLFNPPLTNDTQLVVVQDLRENKVYYAQGFQTASTQLAAAPLPRGLRIDADDTTVMSVGRRRLGLRATLELGLPGSGIERDVTGLVDWTSSSPAIVKVSRMGGLVAGNNGQAVITATLPNTVFSATRAVTVVDTPIVSAPVVVDLRRIAGLFTCTTDSDCPNVTLRIDPPNQGTPIVVAGRPDPARKHHAFFVLGLQPLTTYSAVVTAVNHAGAIDTSPVIQFTTP